MTREEMIRYAGRLVRCRDLREDIADQAALEYLLVFDPTHPGNARGLLKRIVRCLAIHVVWRINMMERNHPRMAVRNEDMRQPIDLAIREEEGRAVRDEVDRLTPFRRDLIRDMYWEQTAPPDIAKVRGCSYDNVNTTLWHTHRRLRNRLAWLE
jgi:DNA-directed RNA polymerase specialized sigma24 family protein